jgi:PAS domain-containing protein
LDRASEFYLVLDPQGGVRQVNDNARRLLGIDARPGKTWEFDKLLTDDSRSRLAGAGTDLLEALEVTPVLSFETPDGRAMPVYVSAVGRLEGGQLHEILLVARSLPLGLRAAGASQQLPKARS